MKRRTFIKSTAILGVAMTVQPALAHSVFEDDLPYKELIGKGNPKLFGHGYKLRLEAYNAFIKLSEAALKSDIRIEIVSSYRSYDHQNRIWMRKYHQNIKNGLSPTESIRKIIEYSTIPGTSRHHWGTDIDIIDANAKRPNNVLNPRHFKNDACFGKLKNWMDLHANDHGFYLVYTNRENRKGFKYEPWHYSYKPLSKSYLDAYMNYDLKSIINSEQLLGGDSFSDEYIENYLNQNILDINPELL